MKRRPLFKLKSEEAERGQGFREKVGEKEGGDWLIGGAGWG